MLPDADVKYFLDIVVDTNGDKKPNRVGRDIFFIYVDQNGVLYPYLSERYARSTKGSNWETSSHYWKSGNNKYCSMSSSYPSNSGDGCLARIIEEGWEMNY